MPLDVRTLFLLGSFVALVPGLLMLFVWRQERSASCLLTWGGGHLIGAIGLLIVLLRGPVPVGIPIQLGYALLLLYYAALWGAVRQFDGRRLLPLGMAAGPALWLIACQLPAFYALTADHTMLASAIASAYSLAAAVELWRGRRERLPSWRFLIGLFLVLALYHAGQSLFGRAFSIPNVTALLPMLTVASSFLLLNLVKERSVRRHQEEARLDPLTGVFNRRGFLEAAERCLTPRRWRDRAPAALLLMDLDHIKQINDRFGHAIGDRVLRLFAAVARAELAPGDVLGRLGGEEFAALLPGRDAPEAMAVADRIRRAFALAGMTVDGCRVEARMSIGVAVRRHDAGGGGLEDLLREADAALYRAKANGRDRVEMPLAWAA